MTDASSPLGSDAIAQPRDALARGYGAYKLFLAGKNTVEIAAILALAGGEAHALRLVHEGRWQEAERLRQVVSS